MDSPRLTEQQLETLSKPELIQLILRLFDEIDLLKKRIDELEGKKSPPKTSQNSSIPPSVDLKRKHNKGDRKNQYGPPKNHKGMSRCISLKPDVILNVPITQCPRTNQPIQSNSQSFKRHQIIELEPAKIIVIEIRRQTTTGPDGKTVVAPNPDGLKDYKRYGPNLKMTIAYMRYEQNVSWKRIWNYFKDIVGLQLGIGTLKSIFAELKEDLQADYETIKQEIKTKPVVGCDETGMHVNGDKWWIHVARTDDTTLYVASPGRDHEVLQAILGADFQGCIVSDFWGAYNERFYPEARFQKCVGGHLLRDVFYAVECEVGKGNYAKQVQDVLLDGLILKKYFIFETAEYIQEREDLEKRLDALVADGVPTYTEEGRRLWKRLKKYRAHVFPFLYDLDLASDNNGSERDIREIVACRKVSESYRTESGIEELVVAKSVLSTLKKRGKEIVSRLKKAFLDPLFGAG